MTNADLENYDYLGLSVHGDMADEIEEAYRALGWQVMERREGERCLLDLRRPHKIPHKDKLQRMQVGLETALNELGDVERKRFLKSTIVTVLGLLFGLSSFALGSYLILSLAYKTAVVIGAVMLVVGSALMITTVLVAGALHKSEDAAYKDKIERTVAEISDLCIKASELLEERID